MPWQSPVNAWSVLAIVWLVMVPMSFLSDCLSVRSMALLLRLLLESNISVVCGGTSERVEELRSDVGFSLTNATASVAVATHTSGKTANDCALMTSGKRSAHAQISFTSGYDVTRPATNATVDRMSTASPVLLLLK